MTKKKTVRYTKKLADEICDLVAQGMTVEQAIKTDPERMPTATSVYRWSMSNKGGFREQLDQAYACFLYVKQEELREISSEDWVMDNLDKFNGDYKMAFEARRARMDALKFLLGKIAPVLSNRFSSKSKLEIEGDTQALSGPQIVVQNYYLEDTSETIKDVTAPLKTLEGPLNPDNSKDEE